jgi:hypothetical protein
MGEVSKTDNTLDLTSASLRENQNMGKIAHIET